MSTIKKNDSRMKHGQDPKVVGFRFDASLSLRFEFVTTCNAILFASSHFESMKRREGIGTLG